MEEKRLALLGWELRKRAGHLVPERVALFRVRHRWLGEFRHAVTFRRIRVEVFRGGLQSANKAALPPGLRFLSAAELARLPLSTPSRKALRLIEL